MSVPPETGKYGLATYAMPSAFANIRIIPLPDYIMSEQEIEFKKLRDEPEHITNYNEIEAATKAAEQKEKDADRSANL